MDELFTQQSRITVEAVGDHRLSVRKFLIANNIKNFFKTTLLQKNIKKEIKNFRKIYCPNENLDLYKEHKNVKKTAQFYRELGSCFAIEKKTLETQIKLILFLIKYIREWDDLIDEKNVPITIAKQLTIPDLEQKEISLILDKESVTKLSKIDVVHVKKTLLAKKNEEFHLAKQLKIPIKQYIKIRNRHISIIEEYFNNEKALVRTKANKHLVRNMLSLGNCDFYLYNALFYFLIPSKEAQKLDNFLKNYFVIDLFLDHIVDLEDDLKYEAFNTLSWFYKSNYGEKLQFINFDQQLKESEMYDLFFTFIEDFKQNALLALDPLTVNKKLYTLLKYYLDGETKGLEIFKKYDFFIKLSPKKRQEFKEAVLKPHPWSSVL